MKKLMIFATLAVAVLATLACSKENRIETLSEPGKLVFTATIGQSTKAYLDDYKTIWEAGDQIAVSNGTDWAVSNAITASDITEGGRCATFTVTLAESSTYYAVYPANAAPTTAPEGDNFAVVIPNTQVIPSGKTVAPEALVQVAKTTDKDKMSFKNVTSLVEFTVPDDGITAVAIKVYDSSDNAACLAGSATINADTPGYVVGSAEKVTLSGSFTKGQNYFAVVWPQTGAGSIRFVFSKGTTKAMRTAHSSFDLPVNGGKNISDFGTINWFDGVIYTKADLDLWASLANYYAEGETVKLGADINYEGDTWTPVNANATNGHFGGLFDGQNHCIYNIVLSSNGEYSGFFSAVRSSELTVRVKNLKLGCKPGTSTADGTSKLIAGSDEVKYVTALAGVTDYAIIDNVSNYIPITFTGPTGPHIGSIVGRIASSSEIKNCNNYADITSESGVAAQYIGGIVGTVAGSNTTISNCTNSGTVLRSKASDAKGNTFIGGILGRTGSGVNNVVITNCHNKGTVGISVDILCAQLYIGGITAMDNAGVSDDSTPNLTVTGCTNAKEGVVVVCALSAKNLTQTGFGGIVGDLKNTSVVKNCNNLGKVVKTGDTDYNNCRYGGIVGYMQSASALIEECNNGSPDDSSLGLVEDQEEISAKKNVRIGGIVGLLSNGTINKCKHYGTVQTRSTTDNVYTYLGGIVGNITVGNITNCECYGSVIAPGATGKFSAGGIAGLQSGANANSTATGCKVAGTISCGYAGNAGLVVGLYTNSKASSFGSESSPVVISSSTVNGIAINASNFETYLAGTDAGISASGVPNVATETFATAGLNTIWGKMQ